MHQHSSTAPQSLDTGHSRINSLWVGRQQVGGELQGIAPPEPGIAQIVVGTLHVCGQSLDGFSPAGVQRGCWQVVGIGQPEMVLPPLPEDACQSLEILFSNRSPVAVQREEQRAQSWTDSKFWQLACLESVERLGHSCLDSGRVELPPQKHCRHDETDLLMKGAGPVCTCPKFFCGLIQAVIADRRADGTECQCHEAERGDVV